MTYYTGSVGSLADLRAAVIGHCVAEGWTNAGNVVHKNGCYVSFIVGNTNEENPPPPANGRLIMLVGNGIDGANNLTDTPTAGVRIGPLRDATGSAYTDWDWPVTYHLHMLENPLECYLLVNYFGNEYWQQLSWGQSPSPGNAGTGNWMSGTLARIGRSDLYRRVNSVDIGPNGSYIQSYYGAYMGPAPFFWHSAKDNSYDVRLSSQIHGVINAAGDPTWSSDYNPLGDGSNVASVSAGAPLQPLMSTQPNNWNNEVALLPCQIFQQRPEAKVSLVGELQHLRFTRNDYFDPGAVIELGPDRWKVYPAYRKLASARDGGRTISHSGTIALAIRYDGP